VHGDERCNCALELPHAAERSPTDALGSDLGEEPFDGAKMNWSE